MPLAVKNHKHKKATKASDSDSIGINTLKPSKNPKMTRAESKDDLPAAPPKCRVVQPADDKEGSEAGW